jgi:hypothetical protein
MKNSNLSKKNSGLPAEVVEQKKKGNTKKPKPYPVPEEDSFSPPQDDSAEVKYNTKRNKHNH